MSNRGDKSKDFSLQTRESIVYGNEALFSGGIAAIRLTYDPFVCFFYSLAFGRLFSECSVALMERQIRQKTSEINGRL